MASEGGSASFKDEAQGILKAVLGAVKDGNSLPKLGDNYELYNGYPAFTQLMNLEGERVLQLLNRVCRHAGAKVQIGGDELMDDEEKLDRLIDANDAILENVGNLLDEAEGLRKKEETVAASETSVLFSEIRTSWNRKIHSNSSKYAGLKRENSGSRTRLFGYRNLPKPQHHFSDVIDNSNARFQPKLVHKHNSREKWKGNVRLVVDGEELEEPDETDCALAVHPYRYELEHWEPLDWQLQITEPKMPQPLETTPCHWIDDVEDLEKLCQTLKGQTEFAVDLEHHSYRSFLGLTCLMQISTRDEDFLVDCLALWKQMHILNEPFTDPRIVKVFHGADCDITWLQRDFGIYVVNLFDTGQAMRLLNFPRYSLAFLTEKLLHWALKKEFRMSDWRIRPLPEELISYAREDTHFLLYCYDQLKKSLLESGNGPDGLLRALDASRKLCLLHYEKPLFRAEDYLAFYGKSKQRFNSQQLWALERLYAWRDATARKEDESLVAVLQDHMLLKMAQVLPKELPGVLACCIPVPPLVRQEQHRLHRIITEARTIPLENSSEEVSKHIPQRAEKAGHPLLNSLHDFSHTAQDEDIKPLLQRLEEEKLAPKKKGKLFRQSKSEGYLWKKQPFLRIFERSGRSNGAQRFDPSDLWISPYEQYQLALEAAAERREKQKKLEEEKAKEEQEGAEANSTSQAAGEEANKSDLDELELLPPPEKKLKKKKKKFGKLFGKDGAAEEPERSPYDYSQHSKQMFRQAVKTKEKPYDPLKLNASLEKKKKKRRTNLGDLKSKMLTFGRKRKTQ